MPQIFQTLKNYLLNVIFPIECLSCHQPDVWLCQSCLDKIPLMITTVCPVCRTPSNGSVCRQCQAQTRLDGLLVATSYEQPLIQQMIHLLKYNYITVLADPLAGLLNKYVSSFDKNNKPAILQSPTDTVVIPVPLHRKRLLERGFNQSALLADKISCQLEIAYNTETLHRIRHTAAQAQLSKQERESNLHHAFTVTPPFKISSKNVILIDDVASTLSTLNECAKVLKQAGSKEVWGLVIARGS
jgi:ComF family protein